MEKKRAKGLYWVKSGNKWHFCEWNGAGWNWGDAPIVTSESTAAYYQDDTFEEINETRILSPDEQPGTVQLFSGKPMPGNYRVKYHDKWSFALLLENGMWEYEKMWLNDSNFQFIDYSRRFTPEEMQGYQEPVNSERSWDELNTSIRGCFHCDGEFDHEAFEMMKDEFDIRYKGK